MLIFRVCSSLVLVAVLACPAFAGFRPSFSIDYSSWHATDIALVTITPRDGTFEVLQAWKGGLNVGERLVIPELLPAPNAIPISRYPKSWSDAVRGGVTELLPREPVGSRMILFLKRSADEQVPMDSTNKTDSHGWKASELMGSMKASLVWMDGDKLYGFRQLINPGPSVLSMLPGSEETLRSRVAEIKGIQEGVTAALAATDGEARAQRLKPYVLSDVFPAQRTALEELGKSASAAVGTIRGMWMILPFASEASELVKALLRAGGEAVGEELSRQLRRELAFWKATGPSLSQGWWNQDARPHAPLRERYSKTHELILGLQQTHYSAALETAIQLRDFWRSLPQLNDPRGLNQMADECDKLIGQLQSSSITGVVTWRGHAGPETAEESKQFRPYRGQLAVKRGPDSQTVATLTTDANGRFSVTLEPGKYFIVRMPPVPGWPRIESGIICVEKNKFTHVKLVADNGMR